jgi:RHH-type proline utilization regulon transcriptional repressor/proline dehydrogenase/delta 1-pyrroline-5-carboxylate dehydrogenase
MGIVIQGYLKSSMADADRLRSIAKSRGAPVTIRLVKGAYWDYETVLARQQGWACPVFSVKAETDQNYERLSRYLLENHQNLLPAFGSHNLRSLAHAFVLADELKVPRGCVEAQRLYGMAEPERKAFRSQGHRVRVYAPVGELLPGMAYLVRRLLENTSNESWLKAGFLDNADVASLVASPFREHDSDPGVERIRLAPERHTLSCAAAGPAMANANATITLNILGFPIRSASYFDRLAPIPPRPN